MLIARLCVLSVSLTHDMYDNGVGLDTASEAHRRPDICRGSVWLRLLQQPDAMGQAQ